ncbi:hypothetical protein KSX_13630 [Ktedonospora formicarum]|uniref:DUF402 domain-containing protein n=2 Tax=Ktedonospora formicarum TaxID=2778364 RepID=A0A8J3HY16_9CHLR|nr:hypothetical protein KSX_13630 [Ktedonospora formicarum]
MMRTDTRAFSGYVSLLLLERMREPLMVTIPDKEVCIADDGYLWLQHFPTGARHIVTSVYNVQRELTRWSIAIVARHYLDAEGLLCYEDLYLTIDVSPQGDIHLLGVADLDQALQKGDVTSVFYEIAWREADHLMLALEEDALPILWQGEEHLEQLLSAL